MEMWTSGKKMIATTLILGILSPFLAGCGGGRNEDMARDNYTGNAPKQGMSRGQKTALMVGAAALYYLYQQRQKSPSMAKQGPTGQLYRSESTGGIYYRDAQGKAVWVSPPKGGIRVPEEEARAFQNRYRDEISRTKFQDEYQPLPLTSDEMTSYR